MPGSSILVVSPANRELRNLRRVFVRIILVVEKIMKRIVGGVR